MYIFKSFVSLLILIAAAAVFFEAAVGDQTIELGEILAKIFSNDDENFIGSEKTIEQLELALTLKPSNLSEEELLSVSGDLIKMRQPDERICYNETLFKQYNYIEREHLWRLVGPEATSSNAFELFRESQMRREIFCQENLVQKVNKELEQFDYATLALVGSFYDKLTANKLPSNSKLAKGSLDFMESLAKGQLKVSSKKKFETQFNELIVNQCKFIVGRMFSKELIERFYIMREFVFIPDKTNRWLMMDLFCKEILANQADYCEIALGESRKRETKRLVGRLFGRSK